MFDMIKFGRRIADIRQNAGLTQTQAARSAGVAPTTWASWEQGRNSPPLAACDKIASVLGVGLPSLLGIYAQASDPLTLKISELDDEEREALSQIVDVMAARSKSKAV